MFILLAASEGFHPLGSSSKARRSGLLGVGSGQFLRGSERPLGLPRSVMLDDSEAPLRWIWAVRRSSAWLALNGA